MARTVARRYAEAIVSLARENGSFETWDTALSRLAGALDDPQTGRFILNPGVPAADKRRAFELILKDSPLEAHNLVRVLTEHRRLKELPGIYELFTEAWLREQGIEIATVTTAEPLSPEDERAVRDGLERMTGHRIEMRLMVDPDIIGGIVARVGDTLIDGSVRTKLRALRQRLAAIPA